MGNETKFSERLRETLKKKGLKQNDLAKLTGINKSTISFYYWGKRHATDYNMYIIAKALNVDIRWLMGYEDESDERKPTKKEELMDKIQNLTEEQAEAFLGLLEKFHI